MISKQLCRDNMYRYGREAPKQGWIEDFSQRGARHFRNKKIKIGTKISREARSFSSARKARDAREKFFTPP